LLWAVIDRLLVQPSWRSTGTSTARFSARADAFRACAAASSVLRSQARAVGLQPGEQAADDAQRLPGARGALEEAELPALDAVVQRLHKL